ncbi:hypothetical protein QQ1_2972 [Clostridioides difficile Y247]|nr:hypothetical protein QQ1_2972 [Clostridioides difficile Y247]
MVDIDISPIISACFILTKWYVNKFVILYNHPKTKGFILTKWYVNSNAIILIYKINGVLY